MKGIYKFTNKINNKKYIGQSFSLERRYKQHKNNHNIPVLSDYNTKFYRALRKYGFENFDYEVIEIYEGDDKEVLNEKERYWIEYYDSFYNGYNGNLGGEKVTERGELHPMHKLTNKQVLEIKELLLNTILTQKEIAEKYNIEGSVISTINTGKAWDWVGDYKYPIRDEFVLRKYGICSVRKLSDEDIMTIRKRYVNETGRKIYEDYKERCSYTAFERILIGKTFKHLPVYRKKEKKWVNML